MNKLPLFFVLISLLILGGCASYNDYYEAGSNHSLNDRARITSAQMALSNTFSETLSKMYTNSSPYLVEMIVYDAKGNPTPLKIKDTGRDTNAMVLAMTMSSNIEKVSQPAPFTMEAPVTIEHVLMKAVDYLPWLGIPFILDKAGAGGASTQTFTADSGGSIAVGGGSSSGSWINEAFKTITTSTSGM